MAAFLPIPAPPPPANHCLMMSTSIGGLSRIFEAPVGATEHRLHQERDILLLPIGTMMNGHLPTHPRITAAINQWFIMYTTTGWLGSNVEAPSGALLVIICSTRYSVTVLWPSREANLHTTINRVVNSIYIKTINDITYLVRE